MDAATLETPKKKAKATHGVSAPTDRGEDAGPITGLTKVSPPAAEAPPEPAPQPEPAPSPVRAAAPPWPRSGPWVTYWQADLRGVLVPRPAVIVEAELDRPGCFTIQWFGPYPNGCRLARLVRESAAPEDGCFTTRE